MKKREHSFDNKDNIPGSIADSHKDIKADDETDYLLKSPAMRKRLLNAINDNEEICFIKVLEKLGPFFS